MSNSHLSWKFECYTESNTVQASGIAFLVTVRKIECMAMPEDLYLFMVQLMDQYIESRLCRPSCTEVN